MSGLFSKPKAIQPQKAVPVATEEQATPSVDQLFMSATKRRSIASTIQGGQQNRKNTLG